MKSQIENAPCAMNISALAARMYAAVQLSSQQQQMYVKNNNTKREGTINNISKIYQIVSPFELHSIFYHRTFLRCI